MKIFMFVNYTPSDKSLGITKKIGSEIGALRSLGHEVYYTAYEEDGVCVYDNTDNVIEKKRYGFKNQRIVGTIRYFCLINLAQEYLNNHNKQFEICYGRLLAPSNKYIHLLKTFKESGCKVILEAHAYFPGIKFQTLKGRYVSFMLEKNGSKLRNYVDRILTEGHIDDFYGIPEVCEAKIGVETDGISAHQYNGSKEELHMISVANEMPYHGYDRIIRSLKAYYSNKDGRHMIFVHLVGNMSDDTIKLIKQLDLNDKVILYGKKYGEELDSIYNKCNMGLGPLGQHRIGGKKDTGLKTKEYFAKGLPYIYSGEEPTVPKDYPYICEFPSDESMIDFDRVWAFYQSYSGNSNVVAEMRKYAKENYSWDSIMAEALARLDQKDS